MAFASGLAEDAHTRVLLLPRSRLLRDLLERTFAASPWIEAHTIEGDAETVEAAVASLEPDWLILELGDDGLTFDVLRLFDARPRAKVLGLAEHGERSLLCIQLGQLSPSTLLRALETIDRIGVLNAVE
jgi:hypothetical protein